MNFSFLCTPIWILYDVKFCHTQRKGIWNSEYCSTKNASLIRWNVYLHIIYIEPKWPLFLKVNPPKQGLNSNQNRGHLGSRCIHRYFNLIDPVSSFKSFLGGPWLLHFSNPPTSLVPAGMLFLAWWAMQRELRVSCKLGSPDLVPWSKLTWLAEISPYTPEN